MRKICIINQKGGVGKTTTTVNLAAGLSREGKKVLIIDLDAQGNISTCLQADAQKDIYDILVGNAEIDECTIHLGKNMDMIQSKESLAKAELILVNEPNREFVLKKKLEKVKGYDYILIDCPPSLSLLNHNALLFADEAIIPVSTDVLGIDALRKMIATVQSMNEMFEHNVTISKIVPTMHDLRNKISIEVLKEMQNEFYELITDPIRINSKLKEAPKAKKSIFNYAKSSRGAQDYEKLVKSVIRDEPRFARKEKLVVAAKIHRKIKLRAC